MEIYFKSKKLQKTLSRERELKKKYGTMAKVIMSRLDDLRYCQHLGQVFYLPGNHHPLTGDKHGKMACSLTGNYRLIYGPVEPVFNEQNELIYESITEIIIYEITDYH